MPKKFAALLVLIFVSVIGTKAIAASESLSPSQEKAEFDKWEKHREAVKLSASLFPNAASVWLYASRNGFDFASQDEPILSGSSTRLTEIEIRKLRKSVFYGPHPYVFWGCGPNLHYVFQFRDATGKEVGKFLYWFDGYHEILPAHPPSEDMRWVMVDDRRIQEIIKANLARIQVAALGRLPCGA